MTYSLEFHEKALKEFKDLRPEVRDRFRDKIKERLAEPRVLKDKLRGYPNRYKIKMKRPPFRLVYEIIDDRIVIQVLAVGKRERSEVYRTAASRFTDLSLS